MHQSNTRALQPGASCVTHSRSSLAHASVGWKWTRLPLQLPSGFQPLRGLMRLALLRWVVCGQLLECSHTVPVNQQRQLVLAWQASTG